MYVYAHTQCPFTSPPPSPQHGRNEVTHWEMVSQLGEASKFLMATLHKQGPWDPEDLSPQSIRRRAGLRLVDERLLPFPTHLSPSSPLLVHEKSYPRL